MVNVGPSLRIAPSVVTLPVGYGMVLSAFVDGVALDPNAVRWTTSDSTVATIDASGHVVSHGAKSGTKVCAQWPATTGPTVCAAVVVTDVSPAARIRVLPDSATFSVGQLVPLTWVSPESALQWTAVTWSVSDSTIATVAPNGLLSIKGGGSVTVCATSSLDRTARGCALFEASSYPSRGPALPFRLSPSFIWMVVGATQQVTVAPVTAGAALPSLTWSSLDSTILAVDGTGRVTARATGFSAACAMSFIGSNTPVCATFFVVTGAPTVDGVDVSTSVVQARVHQLGALSATARAASGQAAGFRWTSTDPSKITVDSAGEFVALALTSGPGVFLCATSFADGTKRGCAYALVNEAGTGTEPRLAPSSPTMRVGDQMALQSTLNLTPGVATLVSWSSLDRSRVGVDRNGVVTALAATSSVPVCLVISVTSAGVSVTCVSLTVVPSAQ